jgi:hypothetical protein
MKSSNVIGWGLALMFVSAGVASSQTLGDVARKEEERRKAVKAPGKVYTNDDLRRYPVTTPDPAEASSDAAKPAGEDAAAPAEAKSADAKSVEAMAGDAKEAKPSVDQGEDHWRKRIGDARSARARSDTYLEALQSRLQALQRDFYNEQDPAQRSAIWAQRTRVFDDLEKLRKDITSQDEAIAKVEEDARKANIPPGWIR